MKLKDGTDELYTALCDAYNNSGESQAVAKLKIMHDFVGFMEGCKERGEPVRDRFDDVLASIIFDAIDKREIGIWDCQDFLEWLTKVLLKLWDFNEFTYFSTEKMTRHHIEEKALEKRARAYNKEHYKTGKEACIVHGEHCDDSPGNVIEVKLSEVISEVLKRSFSDGEKAQTS